MNIYKSVFAICLGVMTLSGCATRFVQNYEGVAPDLIVKTTNDLFLGVVDVRPDILDGSRPACTVGLKHHGMLEFRDIDIYTTDCKPFSDTVCETVENALKIRNVKVTPVPLSNGTSEVDAIKILGQTGRKSILVTVRQWDAATFNQTKLRYELQLSVFDSDGKKLASKTVSGTEKTKRIVKQPMDYAQQFVGKVYKQKLEELFNDPEMAKQF